jgi:hypothetical protein
MVGPKDSEPRPIRRREPVKPKEEKAGRPRTGLVEKQKQWALRAGPGRQRSRRHNSYRVKSWADGRGHGGRGEGGRWKGSRRQAEGGESHEADARK